MEIPKRKRLLEKKYFIKKTFHKNQLKREQAEAAKKIEDPLISQSIRTILLRQ